MQVNKNKKVIKHYPTVITIKKFNSLKLTLSDKLKIKH
jgi:hypothetical protein